MVLAWGAVVGPAGREPRFVEMGNHGAVLRLEVEMRPGLRSLPSERGATRAFVQR